MAHRRNETRRADLEEAAGHVIFSRAAWFSCVLLHRCDNRLGSDSSDLIHARITTSLLLALVLWQWPNVGRGVTVPPYLNLQVSNQVLIVTWTNSPLFHLLESADLITWSNSTRPFSYVGGHYRFRLPPTAPMRFYRLVGSNEPAPRLDWESEFNFNFLAWPNPTPGFTLQSRDNVSSGGWFNETEIPTIGGGYKRFAIPVSEDIKFFRVSQPLNHVLIVGQSLAVGVGGLPVASWYQPFNNKMFVGQSFDSGGGQTDDLSSLVPLLERSDPSHGTGETIASGFANNITAWVGVGEHDLLVSNCGRSGAYYSQLKRGTHPYTRGTNQIAEGYALGKASGYQFRAVFAVHGEGDTIAQDYDLKIREWQSDLANDMRMLTGQLTDPPMFHSQISSWGGFSLSPILTLAEYEANPTKTVLVCPKYFFTYVDGLHLTAESYQWLGEYYAKAYHQHVVRGIQWSPLRPIDITRSNEFITVTFTGNVGDLVTDTNNVSDPRGSIYAPIFGLSVPVTIDPVHDTVVFQSAHQLNPGDSVYFNGQTAPGGLDLGAPGTRYYVRSAPQSNTITVANSTNGPAADFTSTGTNVSMYLPTRVTIGPYGFEYMDDNGSGIPWRCSTIIEAVEIIAPAQIRIRLSQNPIGYNKRLRYAYLAGWDAIGGPTTGRRGCLRDADPTPSFYGHALYNWCVQFDKPVP